MLLRVRVRRHLTGFQSFSYSCISKEGLEGSSNSNLLEISPRKRGRKLKNGPHVILTLDPNKFAEKKQQSLHLSNLQFFKPYVSLLKQSTPFMSTRLECNVTNINETRIHQRYPPGTKAFLYYSIPPEKPRIAGELRLRVVSSNESSFESGSDLLLNGRPWTRPLYAVSKYYHLLYEKLKEERLIPDDLDAALSTFPSKIRGYRQCLFFYTLNDTFIVDFNSVELNFVVITEQGPEKLSLIKTFFDGRAMYMNTPYTGSALARFERSTFPEHKGTRTVVLRFLKIITPVKCVLPGYDDYICHPKEGELYQRICRNSSNRNHRLWSVNIDKSKVVKRGFQLLWDT